MKIIVTIAVFGLAVIVFGFWANKNSDVSGIGEEAQLLQATPVFFEEQKDERGGVEITVIPAIVSDANIWDFKISLDTHSVELNVDLIEAAMLEDEDGREYTPKGWEGDPPGGHHREGILRFGLLSPTSRTIKLIIGGIGGVAEREFLWTIDP